MKDYTAYEAGIEIATVEMHLEREERKLKKALELNEEGRKGVALMRRILAEQDQDALIEPGLSAALEILQQVIAVQQTLQETV